MDLQQFKASLAHEAPPDGLGPALRAMWHQAKDDWDAAHRLAQFVDDAGGAWVHAFLHRIEGDLSNAAYWYRRAGRPVAEASLEREWEEIVSVLLKCILIK
jgi:hypothetical protein